MNNMTPDRALSLRQFIGDNFYKALEIELFNFLNTDVAKQNRIKNYQDLSKLKVIDFIKMIKEERRRISELDIPEEDKNESLIKLENMQSVIKSVFKYDGYDMFFNFTKSSNYEYELYMLKRVNTSLYIQKMARLYYEYPEIYNQEMEQLEEDSKNKKMGGIVALVKGNLGKAIQVADKHYSDQERNKKYYALDTVKNKKIGMSNLASTVALEKINIAFIKQVLDNANPHIYNWRKVGLRDNFSSDELKKELVLNNQTDPNGELLNRTGLVIPGNFYNNLEGTVKQNKRTLVISMDKKTKPAQIQFGGGFVDTLDIVTE